MADTGSTVNAVAGSLRTRRYSMNEPRSKRFVRALADAVIPHLGTAKLRAAAINPDSTFDVLTENNLTGDDEDYTLKGPVRFKANYLDVIFETSAMRPSLRAVSVEAAMTTPAGTMGRTRS